MAAPTFFEKIRAHDVAPSGARISASKRKSRKRKDNIQREREKRRKRDGKKVRAEMFVHG